MTNYSTRISQLDGGRQLEVLRDGQPFTWGPGYRVTRLIMSRQEARALLEYEAIIRLFVERAGEEPPIAKKHLAYVGAETWALERQTSFKVDGTMVQQPWLVLSYIKKSGVAVKNLGFGLDKATGLLEVWNEIEDYAD
jgi:hypothetical protein